MFVGWVVECCYGHGTFPIEGLLLLLHTHDLSVQLYHSCGTLQLCDNSLLTCVFLYSDSRAVAALLGTYGQDPEILLQ